MTIRIGINGFGRVGRQVLKAMRQKYPQDLEVVAINDLFDAATNAHLFKWDSTYGPYGGTVAVQEGHLVVDGHTIHAYALKDPAQIPWRDHGVDIVIESSGRFREKAQAMLHVDGGGAKKVIISAPAKNEDVTIVLGVNDGMYDPAKHVIVSNASCTTNGLAPVAKVLNDRFGIDRGLLTTVHAYTNSQMLLDLATKDLRDARAAAQNIVPSETGAAKAVGLVIPELKGRFGGMAFRVPTATVSVIDFTAILKKDVTVAEINAAMKDYADGPMQGILQYTEEPLVSSDLRGNAFSSIFSAVDTMAMGNLVKAVAWYDNEWGYSMRVADLAHFMGQKL
ncbi:MAG TPA: type I glyceraldehyde-3-phosphate dehydrogenase [Methylococcaceae bacterium]|jgi:glyceraldehyde 3-phosphate dehydrogenase|nr:type I glyceraldehyde-3-phosphate dehydrogenase [Methylococcaceae bacterium]